MKEEPEITPDGTIRFPWATFSPNGDVHTWDNHDVGGENWNANDYPDENKYLQALARTPYKNPAPFHPGEKCYLKEKWLPLQPLTSCLKYMPAITMPLSEARRFFTIVSCEPMRIGEVTEEDARKAGHEREMIPDGSDWGARLVTAKENFAKDWQSKHPGTWPDLWVWRLAIEPSGITG
jgi:hypothetical protein